jgi:hypothetical protein
MMKIRCPKITSPDRTDAYRDRIPNNEYPIHHFSFLCAMACKNK